MSLKIQSGGCRGWSIKKIAFLVPFLIILFFTIPGYASEMQGGDSQPNSTEDITGTIEKLVETDNYTFSPTVQSIDFQEDAGKEIEIICSDVMKVYNNRIKPFIKLHMNKFVAICILSIITIIIPVFKPLRFIAIQALIIVIVIFVIYISIPIAVKNILNTV